MTRLPERPTTPTNHSPPSLARKMLTLMKSRVAYMIAAVWFLLIVENSHYPISDSKKHDLHKSETKANPASWLHARFHALVASGCSAAQSDAFVFQGEGG